MAQNSDLILVTGATGTVGASVCENLVKAGVAVRAAYNSPKGKEKLEKLGVAETVQLDTKIFLLRFSPITFKIVDVILATALDSFYYEMV